MRTVLSAGPAIVLAILGVLALAAPWLAPYPPNEQTDTAVARLRPPGASFHAIRLEHRWTLAEQVERTPDGIDYVRLGVAGSYRADEVRNLTAEGVADERTFRWGSDEFGRDILSRWLVGARLSLGIGVLAVALALSLGVGIGALAGLGPRWLDGLLMRLVDALLAFPWFFLIIALAAIFPITPMALAVLLGVSAWMPISRLARAEIQALRRREFILAARGLGVTELQILFRHILPNVWTPLVIQAALLMSSVILAEASLSFLGLGVQPPDASWGTMIEAGRFQLSRAVWVVAFPAAGLVATVLALNLLADRLRDLLDPRLRTVDEIGSAADPGATGSSATQGDRHEEEEAEDHQRVDRHEGSGELEGAR
ncbi:MAG: ABC transporter permease [Acidobacteriota bacterium]